MSELRNRIAARPGHYRDRLDEARKWAEDHGGALDADDLRELANGPILDPLRPALPMGKCSEAEWRKRNRCE